MNHSFRECFEPVMVSSMVPMPPIKYLFLLPPPPKFKDPPLDKKHHVSPLVHFFWNRSPYSLIY